MNNVFELYPDRIPEEVPEMITIRDASQRTGLSYDCLRKMCLRDQIVYVKAGSKFLINVPKLIEYLNTGNKHGGENIDR